MADYCSDAFKMVEDNEDSFRMWQGLVGPHFTPQMSQDGTLTWSNNAGLPNPGEVNIMGPQGAGIRIAGLVETEAGLPTRSDVGGIWLVGTELPYEGWAFLNGEWIDLGPMTVGPAGPPGPQGDDYELTENDKNEIAGLAAAQFVTQLEATPLPIRNGGTGARDLSGAQENLGIAEILTKLGTWPLGTDAQDVAGAVNEMIGEIAAQNAGIAELREIQAPDFDPAAGVYDVGDLVLYDGQLYRCTTAVTTPGAWTGSANWTQTTAAAELEALADRAAVQDLYFNLGSKTGTGSAVTWTLNDARITAKHRAFTGDVVFGTPSAVVGNGTLTTANGSVTLSVPVNGTTTAAVHLWYDPDYSG